jgi:hypothetical protein
MYECVCISVWCVCVRVRVCVPSYLALSPSPYLYLINVGANEDYLLLAEHGRLTAAAGLFSDSVSRYHVSHKYPVSLTVICWIPYATASLKPRLGERDSFTYWGLFNRMR